ncbi:MAG: nucleotidyltransferase domain-containing protein [Actinobacteria bacterium]|nr:nucleotidyltransferase domain-containing protein [Actinomycetota bacterium]
MFALEARDRIRDRVLEMARGDERVVAAAIVGSLAHGVGDRWSDVDLSFAVRDDVRVSEVLDDWSRRMTEELDAVCLIDLTVGQIIYRVFLFAGCLQLDVSFTPASEFRPTSPRFCLVFGVAGEPYSPEPPSPHDLLRWAVLYARGARVSIERGKVWQAEHCLANLRIYALSFACRRRNLPASFGKGLDQLPPEVLAGFPDSLVSSVERLELTRALKSAVSALLSECASPPRVASKVEDHLRDVVAGI